MLYLMVKLRKSKKCYLREDLGLNICEILRMCTHVGNNAYVFFSVSHVVRNKVYVYLKGLAQAKIIKKSVILFRVLNMTI